MHVLHYVGPTLLTAMQAGGHLSFRDFMCLKSAAARVTSTALALARALAHIHA